MTPEYPILLSEKQIKDRIQALSGEIEEHYKGLLQPKENLLVLGVLTGSFIFAADLVRALNLPCEIDFIQLKSYEGRQSTGKVQWVKDTKFDLSGRHCLVVEDIVDTGLTAQAFMKIFSERNAASVRLCSLLHKPSRQEVEQKIDFLGFSIEDHFVVGYGLDYNDQWRQQKDIVIYQGE